MFDEVYYAKFALAYLHGEPVFDAHPPMGKYLIAVGIWLGERVSWLGGEAIAPEVDLTPISFRWMTALVGALIPLVVTGIGRALLRDASTGNRHRGWLFALLAGGFVAVDGLFVTEARYALLNTYVVFFGLLGHLLWLYARTERGALQVLLQVCSSVALGAAIATKWNGLGYVLSLLLWESWQGASLITISNKALGNKAQRWERTKQIFQQISWRTVAKTSGFLIALPVLAYSLIWWPHLRLNQASFLSIHRTLFLFHQGLDEMQAACSRWYTWPLLIKPIAYWYEESTTQAYTVNNLGNPALWWLSSAAMVALCVRALYVEILRTTEKTAKKVDSITTYVVTGYLANWLPWAMVGRCTYIYLYMPAAIFSFMGLAWLLSDWLSLQSTPLTRQMGFVMVGAIALSFFFWLPLSIGSPLTPEQLQLRWWLPSWI